ncbi:hypothetical protein F4802DRAFT_96019 [Xylaria palmicola]|nr:hypothetical protein F4802DRAFT_96019 [Xylaria palmicola]
MPGVCIGFPVAARQDGYRDRIAATANGASTSSRGSSSVSDEEILQDIADVCGVPVTAIEDLYPCTPLQVGIMAQPIERIYINCIYATLVESVDVERFCEALCHIYTVNTVLRTRIVDSELGLVQVVLSETLSIARSSSLSPSGQDDTESLVTVLEREKSAPMRLGTPLFRAALVDRTIVLTTHHAIADGGTYHRMFDNLSRAYHGQPLPPYADFKLFVKHCHSIDPTTARAFWAPRFSGHPVAFPTMDVEIMPDARCKVKTNISFGDLPHEVPVGLMSSYVETAWAATAMSYTGAESIVFGRVLSARVPLLAGLESTLGPTIVTMPVQVNLSRDMTIGALIREQAQERREALKSEALQYGLVGLRTVNDAAKMAARFTTLINFRTPTAEGTDYTNADLDIHGEYEAHLPYGLGISIVFSGKGLAIETLYDLDIVCERQTRRILRQLEHFLKLLLQSPAGTQLGELPLLNTHDRQEMIVWNRLVPEPVELGLHDLFRVMARTQPDAPAIEGPDGHFTYATLDSKTDAIAKVLRSRGIGKEDALGLVFDKSVWAIVAQLAVLKAGGVCVPIDPSFPAARKETILSGSGAKMILTSRQHCESFTSFEGPVLVLDELQVKLNGVEPCNGAALPQAAAAAAPILEAPVSPTQAAFILFTSGSTGTPKGHILEHRNLVSSLRAIGRAMGFSPGTRMLQFAAYVWDMSIAETHGTLLAGGCVSMPSDEARESFVAGYIASQKVNTAIFTPTVLRLLAPDDAPSLKTIMSIGEPVDLGSADAWAVAGCRFFNAWGPSETACVSAMAELTSSTPYRGSIGRPLASAIWLVAAGDKDSGRLVPIGGVGEMVVEGMGVARGYLNSPQQTAASFIARPRWAPNRRSVGKIGGGDSSPAALPPHMYRTGDLARYNPDGSLQYVGRQDSQVKVNGQRVELGEVEKALMACEGVRHALTIVQALREGSRGRKSLIAVVVLDEPPLQTRRPLRELSSGLQRQVIQAIDDMRKRLAARLPSYMVPSVWKVVEDFPRTTSLKIDRSSIKKWLLSELGSEDRCGAGYLNGDELAAPASHMERCLQIAWAAALEIPKSEVGRESSFIKLGGDSILGIKVATLCRKRGVRVSVATLLRSGSLAKAAEGSEMLENGSVLHNNERPSQANGVSGTAPAAASKTTRTMNHNAAEISEMQSLLEDLGIDMCNVEVTMPCSPLQEGILLSQVKNNGHGYWMRVTMKLTPAAGHDKVDEDSLRSAWEAVCAAQPILRTIFVSYETRTSAFQQVIFRSSPTSVKNVNLPGALDEQKIGRTLASMGVPYLPAAHPQHHLVLARASPTVTYATLHINHALFDERSVNLLGEQLNQAYRRGSNLPKGISLAAYLDRIEETMEATQEYWKKYLSGVEPCNMPELSPGESKIIDRGSDLCDVPIKDAHRLAAFCRSQSVTVANLMQAAWATVLRICTGCQSATFGYLQSHAALVDGGDSIMGPLLAMAYCRVQMGGDAKIGQILGNLNADASQALEYGACSLSELQESLKTGSSPLFNTIMTIYRLSPPDTTGTAAAAVAASGLKVEHLPLHGHTEYTMTLGVAHDRNAIYSKLLFDPSRVSSSFASAVATLLAAVVDKMVNNTQQSIGALEASLSRPMTLFAVRDIAWPVIRKAAAQCELGTGAIESVRPCDPLQCRQMAVAVALSNSDLDQYVFQVDATRSTEAVHDAWERLVVMCPALRCRIVSLDGYGIYQVTLKSGVSSIWADGDSLSEYLQLDRETPTRYGRPLCRLGQVIQPDGLACFVLSLHRTVHDAWTISLIERTLVRACSGAVVRPIESYSYFRSRIACRLAASTGRSRMSISAMSCIDAAQFPRFQPSSHVVKLSGSRSLRIDKSTSTEVLFASWALCLCRVTGDSKVCFGAYMDGRNSATPDLYDIAGPVGALITYSMDLSSAPTITSHLDLVRSSLEREASPAQFLQASSQPFSSFDGSETTSAARNVLVIDRSPMLLLQGLAAPAVKRVQTHMAESSPFGDSRLVLRCSIMEEETVIHTQFDERVISYDDVGLLLAQYQHAIEQISSRTNAPWAELPILSEHEMSLLRGWNQDVPVAEDSCIHDQISSKSRAQPAAPAICSWDHNLSHGELDELSDRVAVYLSKMQTVAKPIVPYFLEKSAVTVIIMLGILKAGGTLLPLDSKHPAERLRSIIAESGASMVITTSTLRDAVKDRIGDEDICEMNMDVIYSLSSGPCPAVTVAPSDLCYIIYTSGSSGKPKGVMITHSNMSTSTAARREFVGMGPGTRTLQYLNLIFDVSMFDIFLTLVSGGCVCLPSEEEWSSNMTGAIRRTRANFAFLTPSLATLLSPADVPTLRTLALTGEPCESQIIRKWEHVRVLNMYGPAEATVHSSGADVSLHTGRHHLNIGRAGGCVYWAVDRDDHQRLVAIGCPGELLIQGPIVARGYLNNAKKTAAAFIDPPVWASMLGLQQSSPSCRWYKTGDLVVQTANGSMIYQGRKDTQVKLSGQRIELGEIEYHLTRSVKSPWDLAVELVRPSGNDEDSCLVVFFADTAATVSRTTSNARPCGLLPPLTEETAALPDKLTASLPPYMIPRFFVRLRQLPMTSSGKTDRASLRRIGASMSTRELGRYNPSLPDPMQSAEIAPSSTQQEQDSTDLRTAVRQLWSDTLGIPLETIKNDDNFFSIGGSSIRATRLSHAARRAGLDLRAPDVFRAPTFKEMAAVARWRKETAPTGIQSSLSARLTKKLLDDPDFMSSCLAHTATRPDLDLTAGNIKSIAVATDVQADMVAVGELDGLAWHNEMTIDSAAALDVARLRSACAVVIRRHPMFRTTFVQYGDRLYQVESREVQLEKVIAATMPTTATDTSSATTVLNGESQQGRLRPLEEDFLPRFHLRHLSHDGRGCHKLCLTIHHAHYDAISMDMVLRDLRQAYAGHPLPPSGPSFHEWVTHVNAQDAAPSRTFWTAALQGSSMTCLVPAHAPATPHFCSDTAQIRVPLAHVANNRHGTPSSVVQAAWALVLSRATARDDVVFCAPHANRDVASFRDADRVCGLCLNFVPARARLREPTMTLAALVRQLQAQAVAAIPHQQLGFRSIVRECTTWPAWTRYGSMLIYQNHESLRRSVRFGGEGGDDDNDKGTECVLTPHGRFGRCADILVEATPDEEGQHLVVDLLFSRRTFTDAQISWITQTFEGILRAVPESLDLPITEVGMPRAGTPSLMQPYPMATPFTHEPEKQSSVPAPVSARTGSRGGGEMEQVVRRAWRNVGLLTASSRDSNQTHGSEGAVDEDDDYAMYSAGPDGSGGDLVSTLLLAREYQRHGVPITMQQLIDNPTKRAQSRMISGMFTNRDNATCQQG